MVEVTRAIIEEAGSKEARLVRRYPVAEIFGPTIQGEGEEQGTPAYFVRFGGCDYKCEWCDTPHAVLPGSVKHLPRRSPDEILEALRKLAPGPTWVVLTGGNPALHDLSTLVNLLHHNAYKVSIETQATRWKDWISECDSICLSPKPPSSGMDIRRTERSLSAFTKQLSEVGWSNSFGVGDHTFLKIVVFDHADYEWAKKIHREYFYLPMYLSAGNDAGKTVGRPERVDNRTKNQVVVDLLERFRWLTNRVMVDPEFADVRVQAQMHVLTWGNEIGR